MTEDGKGCWYLVPEYAKQHITSDVINPVYSVLSTLRRTGGGYKYRITNKSEIYFHWNLCLMYLTNMKGIDHVSVALGRSLRRDPTVLLFKCIWLSTSKRLAQTMIGCLQVNGKIIESTRKKQRTFLALSTCPQNFLLMLHVCSQSKGRMFLTRILDTDVCLNEATRRRQRHGKALRSEK